MKKFKDFIYDQNDIIITLVILAIAVLLILWRMDVIMDYPNTLATETDTVKTSTEDVEKSRDKEHSSSELWDNGALSRDISVTVSGGTASGAVQCLIDAGLFKSYEEYEQVCNGAGIDPLQIKASTFNLSKGSTKVDIARVVTK